MPVVIEKVEHPNAQDLIDLEKIYLDYPTDFRFSHLQDLLATQATTQATTSLYGGRFNNRLVGALTITSNDNTAIINHLCTRKITRQRNIAKDLLRQLLLHTSYKTYTFSSCLEIEALDRLFLCAGFKKTGVLYQLNREQSQ